MTKPFNLELDDAALRRALANLQQRLADTRPLMRGIAADLLFASEEAFMDEGPGWPALAPATVKARALRGKPAHPILQITNALARSVVTHADRNEARVGSNLAYAAIQQLGGKAGKGQGVTIPARPYLPITQERQLTPAVKKTVLATVRAFLRPAP